MFSKKILRKAIQVSKNKIPFSSHNYINILNFIEFSQEISLNFFNR